MEVRILAGRTGTGGPNRLGQTVEVYRYEMGGLVVGRGWMDPDVSRCQLIVVGSDGLTRDEFTRVVESVAQVEP